MAKQRTRSETRKPSSEREGAARTKPKQKGELPATEAARRELPDEGQLEPEREDAEVEEGER